MATSGTYTFNPGLGEITLYAYNLIGVRNTAVLQEHMEAARMASNMMLSRWSNQGVNLWAVDLQTVSIVAGTTTYSVPSDTVVILDAYMRIDDGVNDPIDRFDLLRSQHFLHRAERPVDQRKPARKFPNKFFPALDCERIAIKSDDLAIRCAQD